MSVRSLKLCYDGEIRRFSLESINIDIEGGKTSSLCLEHLKEVVRNTFQRLKHEDFTLTYFDDEDERITIKTDGK